MSNKTLKIIAPIVVIVVGIAGAWLLASSRRSPERVERPPVGPLVEVMPVQVTSVPVVVTGHGEVVPRVAVDVVPQVSGQVVDLHPSLVAGGFFRAHQTLVTIDPRDYELALERAQASVARALVNLEREQAEAEVARQEWNELHPGEDPTALVIREPQIRQAEAELAAAEADLSVARLNLERTRVSLPFDGVVVSESVDVGQFVGGTSRLARVYGTDVVDVRVPLDSGELAWFEVPTRSGGVGSQAEVSASFGGAPAVWRGRVTRMEAEVDQSSRMVHVVIEVRDPYARTEEHGALLPGTFVDVKIFGRVYENVVPVPRHALRDGGRVWIYDDGRLDIRQVEVQRSDRDQVLVSAGLEADDLIIISALDAVTDGMKVRDASDQADVGGTPTATDTGETSARLSTGPSMPGTAVDDRDRAGRRDRSAT